MSFGWSIGDILAGIQLLHTITISLQSTGGASSSYQESISFLSALTVTLEHLSALQSAPLDPDIQRNLLVLCGQVQGPVKAFCDEVRKRYAEDLGEERNRKSVGTVPKKIRWALGMVKRVKELREKVGGTVAAIGVVLGQQVVQTTLRMPAEIQAKIAQTIDQRIGPQTVAVHDDVRVLIADHTVTSEKINILDSRVQNVGTVLGKEIREEGEKNRVELEDKFNALDIGQKAQVDGIKDLGVTVRAVGEKTHLFLENKFNSLSLSQKTQLDGISELKNKSTKTLTTVEKHIIETRITSTNLQELFTKVSSQQSKSTDLVLRQVLQTGKQTALALRHQNSTSRDQTSSLHQKLDRMNWLMVAVKDRVGDLSTTQKFTKSNVSNSELKQAIRNMQKSIWLLVSALHVVLRELMYLLAPYLVALYKTSIQPLMLHGDHFLFEDAIGRRKWLPCLQFQQWSTFYHLLIDTFQGEPGLSKVLNGQFVVLNGFNETPIHKKAWRSGIQPKARVAMAIMLEYTAAKKGRCANPDCAGVVNFGEGDLTRVCPVCGKHVSTLKDSLDDDEEFIATETSFAFDFGTEIQIPALKTPTPSSDSNSLRQQNSPPSRKYPKRPAISPFDADVRAYKRVIWQEAEEPEYPTPIPEPNRRTRRDVLRSRGVTTTRPKPSTRRRKAAPHQLLPSEPYPRDLGGFESTVRGRLDRTSHAPHPFSPDPRSQIREPHSRNPGEKSHYQKWLEQQNVNIVYTNLNIDPRGSPNIPIGKTTVDSGVSSDYDSPQFVPPEIFVNDVPTRREITSPLGPAPTRTKWRDRFLHRRGGNTRRPDWQGVTLDETAKPGTVDPADLQEPDEDSDDEPIMASRGRKSPSITNTYKQNEPPVERQHELYSQYSAMDYMGRTLEEKLGPYLYPPGTLPQPSAPHIAAVDESFSNYDGGFADYDDNYNDEFFGVDFDIGVASEEENQRKSGRVFTPSDELERLRGRHRIGNAVTSDRENLRESFRNASETPTLESQNSLSGRDPFVSLPDSSDFVLFDRSSHFSPPNLPPPRILAAFDEGDRSRRLPKIDWARVEPMEDALKLWKNRTPGPEGLAGNSTERHDPGTTPAHSETGKEEWYPMFEGKEGEIDMGQTDHVRGRHQKSDWRENTF